MFLWCAKGVSVDTIQFQRVFVCWIFMRCIWHSVIVWISVHAILMPSKTMLYYYRSFDWCKLDYRTERNRIRLTLFSFKLPSTTSIRCERRSREEKNERRFECFFFVLKRKNMMNPSALASAWVKRIKFCWLIGWNVSWQPRRHEQCVMIRSTKSIRFHWRACYLEWWANDPFNFSTRCSLFFLVCCCHFSSSLQQMKFTM